MLPLVTDLNEIFSAYKAELPEKNTLI